MNCASSRVDSHVGSVRGVNKDTCGPLNDVRRPKVVFAMDHIDPATVCSVSLFERVYRSLLPTSRFN